ncbi:MAG: hypothetical protein LKK13_04385 [Bacilli bacterium]|jgi:hypothetical protein|nr:hypothetical protein [Bacilli bacterium]
MNAKVAEKTIVACLGVLALASCTAGKVIDRAEAETLLTSISENPGNFSKVTYTLKDCLTDGKLVSGTEVIDMDKSYEHVMMSVVSGGTTTHADSYYYIRDNVAYEVDAANKVYASDDSSLDISDVKTHISKDAAAIRNVTPQTADICNKALAQLDAGTQSVTGEAYHSAGEGNVSIEFVDVSNSANAVKYSDFKMSFSGSLLTSMVEGTQSCTVKYGTASVSFPNLSGYNMFA